MDKEVAKKFLLNIQDEYKMIEDMPISEKLLDYLKDLMKVEKKLNKAMKGDINESIDVDDETEIDNYLMSAWDEFSSYKNYKQMYDKTKQSDDLSMAHDELGHFLNNLCDVFRELSEISKDNMDERSMVKSKVKEIYQMFH